jgi:hypothetical protein
VSACAPQSQQRSRPNRRGAQPAPRAVAQVGSHAPRCGLGAADAAPHAALARSATRAARVADAEAVGRSTGPRHAVTRPQYVGHRKKSSDSFWTPLGWNQSNLLGQDRFLNDRHWTFDPFRLLRTYAEIDADQVDDERRDVGMQHPKEMRKGFKAS